MDPTSAYAAYGYESGYSAGGDSSDPSGGQFGWNQWQQPTAQHQQNQHFGHGGQSHQTGFGAFSGSQSFGQPKQAYMKANQGAQKPGQRGGLGFGSSGMNLGSFAGDWSQPPSQSSFSQPQANRGGTFPGKKNGGGGFGNGNQQRNKGFGGNRKPNVSHEPKKLDPTGKSPAMLLHEIFKNVTEDYSEAGTPKKYKCTLTVEGQQFSMESNNKKAAKQKCSELVIRSLRPEIEVTPYEEIVAVTKVATPAKVEVKKEVKTPQPAAAQASKRNAASMLAKPVPAPNNNGNAKKVKLAPVDSALSLLDFMRKIIAESTTVKYNPVFEASELDVKIKQDPEAAAAKTPEKKGFRNKDIEHTVSLKFEEQNKCYTKTGPYRNVLKEMVVREALRDLFGVSLHDIRTVSRRCAVNKLNSDVSIIQTLQQICTLMNCTLTLDAEPSEDKPIGDGKMFFVGKCKIVDHFEADKPTHFVSPSMASKHVAKEYAAQEMLKNYFDVDADNYVPNDNGVQPQGPCSVLHSHLVRKHKGANPKIVYEFKDTAPPVAGQQSNTVFHCDCVIEEERFTGSGRSKKLAKSNAACAALLKLFAITYDPNEQIRSEENKRRRNENISPLLRDVSEFAKREYIGMCGYFNIQPSNQLACFFLVNDKDEKRLISIGSSIQYVVEPDTLSGANGTALIHLDPIVLARRSLIRYFIEELTSLETKPDQSSVFDFVDGKAKLKENLRLVLYSTFPPVCAYSVDDAPKKRLAYVTPTTLAPAPDDTLSYDEIKATKQLRIHCTADKMYKWSVLGVQGALLSKVLHPVFLNNAFFGSEAPVPDDSLKFALSARLGENARQLELESIGTQLRIVPGCCHAWTRGFDIVEQIDYNTGRTTKGSPSNLCKAEVFEAFRKIGGVDKDTTAQYAQAKLSSTEYQKAKAAFYEKLEKGGLGKWQTKPTNLTDDFTPISFD